MLHDRTIQHITKLRDEALAEYIASSAEVYEADAISFAREEFQKRGLASQDLLAVQKIGRERAADAARMRKLASTAPLKQDGKLLAFVFCLVVISPVYFIFWLRLSRVRHNPA